MKSGVAIDIVNEEKNSAYYAKLEVPGNIPYSTTSQYQFRSSLMASLGTKSCASLGQNLASLNPSHGSQESPKNVKNSQRSVKKSQERRENPG